MLHEVYGGLVKPDSSRESDEMVADTAVTSLLFLVW